MHTYMYLVTEWSRCSTRAVAATARLRGPAAPPPAEEPGAISRAGDTAYTTTHRFHRSHTDPTPPHRCAWRGSRICRAGPRSAPPKDTLDVKLDSAVCCLSTLSAFRTHTQHHDRREKRTRSLLHASAHPRRHVRRKSLRLHVLVCGWARLKDSEEHLGSRPWLVSAPLGEADHDAAGERGEDGKAEHDVVARARDLAEGEHAPEC